MIEEIEINGKKIKLEDGFLKNFDDWNLNVMYFLARRENIEIDEETVELVKYVRKRFKEGKTVSKATIEFYMKRYGNLKIVAKKIKEKFPKGYKQIYKIAGIPKCGCL